MEPKDEDFLESYLDALADQVPSLGVDDARKVLRGLCGEILAACAEAVRADLLRWFSDVIAKSGGAKINVFDLANAVLQRISAVGGVEAAEGVDVDRDASDAFAYAFGGVLIQQVPPFQVVDMTSAPEEQVAAARAACKASA